MMTISTLALGKGSAFGNHRLATCLRRSFSNAAAAVATEHHKDNGHGNTKPARLVQNPNVQRELFMNVLEVNATRRDAKQYLARFKPPNLSTKPAPKLLTVQEERNARHRRDQDRLERIGVNLGGLYAPARAIAESPQFKQQGIQDQPPLTTQPALHVALVCLREPESLDRATIEGLAITLSQLVKLDMQIVLILGLAASNIPQSTVKDLESAFAAQADRLCQALFGHSPEAARFVPGALETDGKSETKVDIPLPELVLKPLKRGIIPIVPSLAYTPSGQLVQTSTEEVMAALTRQLSNNKRQRGGADEQSLAFTSLDRIIVLDPAGGVPSKDRGDGAHVFINLEQELNDITNELVEYAQGATNGLASTYDRHRSNLHMLQRCLALLPSASSALIISPQEAASSSQASIVDEPTIGARTRRQKNTLIHNLLTNKPTVSSSLPAGRFSSIKNVKIDTATPLAVAPTATLVKRGMPLSVIPALERGRGWQRPASGFTSLSLERDPRVDLARLIHLIDDSFRRKLDVQHYLDRVQGRIAGLLVAGEYEGGAIFTWEQPQGTSDAARLVPYLDKFAVLQSSQGSSGVADILFQAMVRSCFPRGVCWRSRKDNPVNKWYFERAAGSWQIPETNWTMFWTGEGVVEDAQRFQDYVRVCTAVVPSWADGKKPD